VILESGTNDYSVIWALVAPTVARFTRVCAYDRGGYAWSDPGRRPRTFTQLALELREALRRLGIAPPYVLVGQSYGGLVVRGFAKRYRTEVVGMVLVDAVHEDQHIVYGGEPHLLRDGARHRPVPPPSIELDTAIVRQASALSPPPPAEGPLPDPLGRLPASAQAVWRWADRLAVGQLSAQAERDWSPEELAVMHDERSSDRATLGDLPLVVLARTSGGYETGMAISADSLERERRRLMADLAALSHHGRLIYAPHSGHNIHLEDPDLVVRAIQSVLTRAR
jgi:pimeloyl-ACP methyl ester carboxylesterase